MDLIEYVNFVKKEGIKMIYEKKIKGCKVGSRKNHKEELTDAIIKGGKMNYTTALKTLSM